MRGRGYNKIDLVGQKFGEWQVLSAAPSRRNVGGSSETYWACRCSCGKLQEVAGKALRKAKTTKCNACAGRARVKPHNVRVLHATTFHVWTGMKQRCYCPTNQAYDRYGGRGITMSPRWLESFENFLEDMGPKPDSMSLDRIDVNGSYSKENCRWATTLEQANNTRVNFKVEYEGTTFTLSELARHCGVKYLKLHNQLRTRGRPLEEAIQRARSLEQNTSTGGRSCA